MSDLQRQTVGVRFEPVVKQPQKQQSWVLVCGVALPLAVVVFELATRFCAQNFFDPMPTLAHVALITFVPVSNLLLWLQVNGKTWPGFRQPPNLRWAMVLNGAALAIAGFYSLIFLPMLPLALLALIVGIGALPLAPFGSFVAALALRGRLRTAGEAKRVGLLIGGVAAGLGALVLLDVPAAATRLGVQWAASDDIGERQRGLSLLRTLGDEDLLLRLCYDTTGRPSGPLSGLLALANGRILDGPPRHVVSVPQGKIREIYYRVTGEAFNAKLAPSNLLGRSVADDFVWDADHGGAQVGGRIAGLELASSRIDGSVSAADQVGYLEWVLEFRNASALDRETRMQLILPPGGVVSRATLWVNGEEREAAYGGRAEVREAYRKVAVVQRRDPLLVTTKGADRVLVQAFPVPRGGSIKFKIGITAPIAPEAGGKGQLFLPAIFDRNFSMNADFRHTVWIEGNGGLTASLASLNLSGVETASRFIGRLTDGELTLRRPSIVTGTADTGERHARLGDGESVVQQVQAAGERAAGFMVVIDGSERMRRVVPEILTAIDALPEDVMLGAVLAADPVVTVPPAAATREQKVKVANMLRASAFVGGQDNAAGLTAALLGADAVPGMDLLWVHGPQPHAFAAGNAALEQAVSRLPRPPGITLYGVEPGPNDLLPDAPWGWRARMLPQAGSVGEDLSGYFKRSLDTTAPVVTRHEAQAGGDAPAQGSDHIARLWARDRVIELASSGGEDGRKAAIDLAVRYRLVTPVSGAVVLETKQQFDDSRLTPVEKASVPTIPEPHEWALILVACAALLWLAMRRRGFERIA